MLLLGGSTCVHDIVPQNRKRPILPADRSRDAFRVMIRFWHHEVGIKSDFFQSRMTLVRGTMEHISALRLEKADGGMLTKIIVVCVRKPGLSTGRLDRQTGPRKVEL